MDAAVRAGVPQDQAARAASTFSAAMARQMARGVPAEVAMARAESAFQAEASVPPPRTLVEAATRSLSAGDADIGRSLDKVVGARTPAGHAASERALAAAMGRGLPLDEALAAASAAARASEAAAAADASPQASLAGAADPIQVARALPPSSPAFDRVLSALLARGLPPAEAIERAQRASANAGEGNDADARNPAAALARFTATAAAEKPIAESVDRALGVALARGLSVEQAVARAAEIERAERAAVQADASSPDNAFVRPTTAPPPVRSPVFDQALAVALARGVPAAQAVEQAQRREAETADPAPLTKTALASGEGLARVLPDGGSKAFRAALNNALARGVPLAQAVTVARRVEAQSAFRYTLPPGVSRQLGNGQGLKITTADGRPLPSWLTFDARRGQFVGLDVPDGGLPLPVVLELRGKRVPVTIDDAPARR